jgi:hypothetical protein
MFLLETIKGKLKRIIKETILLGIGWRSISLQCLVSSGSLILF